MVKFPFVYNTLSMMSLERSLQFLARFTGAQISTHHCPAKIDNEDSCTRTPFGNKYAEQYQQASSVSQHVNYQEYDLTSTEGKKPSSQRSFLKIDELHGELLQNKLTHSHTLPTRNPSTANVQADTFVTITTPNH